jgi:RHS repeat-associated protein
VVEATSYDPWGEVKSGGTASKFLYTGQERDAETNLHYYNVRYYDPHIRRFMQPDDIIQNGIIRRI